MANYIGGGILACNIYVLIIKRNLAIEKCVSDSSTPQIIIQYFNKMLVTTSIIQYQQVVITRLFMAHVRVQFILFAPYILYCAKVTCATDHLWHTIASKSQSETDKNVGSTDT
uniref:Uncharacterized protein n=1 Tax=Schizaphis graminum TaxID=13262 RepID=A0A2S2NVJ6_SCHGA